MGEWSWAAYTALEVLVAIACCLGNVLVICAVVCGGGGGGGIRTAAGGRCRGGPGSGGGSSSCSSLTREPTFCFLVSLAWADLLVGVAAVPLAVLLDGWATLGPGLCLLLSCVVLVLTQASVLSLLAIAVDRYLRLHTPLRYKDLATRGRTCLAVCVCWVLSCVLGFTPLFGWHNHPHNHHHQHAPNTTTPTTGNHSSSSYPSPTSSAPPPPCTFLSVVSLPFMVYFNFLGCVLAPLLLMTLLYARVFWSLRWRLALHQNSCPQTRASLLRERRLACSLALVLGLFAGCWLPLHLMNCLLLHGGPGAVPQGALYAGILLSHANSAVNPVVYAYRIPKIRRAYAQIWRHFLTGLNCPSGGLERAERSLTVSRANNNRSAADPWWRSDEEREENTP